MAGTFNLYVGLLFFSMALFFFSIAIFLFLLEINISSNALKTHLQDLEEIRDSRKKK